ERGLALLGKSSRRSAPVGNARLGGASLGSVRPAWRGGGGVEDPGKAARIRRPGLRRRCGRKTKGRPRAEAGRARCSTWNGCLRVDGSAWYWRHTRRPVEGDMALVLAIAN